MYYVATFRMLDGLDRDLFTTPKMQRDAVNLLEHINCRSVIRIRNGEITSAVSFRYRGIVQKSFELIAFHPLRINPDVLVRALNNKLGEVGLQREYFVSSIEIGGNIRQLEQGVQHTTQNDRIIDLANMNRAEIPERFFCALTAQLMDDPVRLPNGSVVDRIFFERNYVNNPVNPFTNESMTREEAVEEPHLLAEIRAFIQVEVFARDIVDGVNRAIGELTLPLHSAYMLGEGNPYGDERQRYALASSKYSIWATAVTRDRDQRMVDHYRLEEIYTPLNYPHPDHTLRAVKDAYHALITKNPERFNEIVSCYPAEAREFLYAFANRLSTPYVFNVPKPMQRPHTQSAVYSLEPRRIAEGRRIRLPLEIGEESRAASDSAPSAGL